MKTARRIAGAMLGLTTFLVPMASQAEIIGVLEQPSQFASGISNIQGWAFTTTPGAKLNQPFQVLINGIEKFEVPCCGDRGDVQEQYPQAPLHTGFSTVYNWGLEEVGSESGESLLVQVVVTDDQGDSAVLSTTVELYKPTTWPFSVLAQWEETDLIASALDSAAASPININSQCFLSNDAIFTLDAAKLTCTNLIFTAIDARTEVCPLATFSWDRASQSFRLTGGCDPAACREIDQTCATDDDCCEEGRCESPVVSGSNSIAPVCVTAALPVDCRSNITTTSCEAVSISSIDCSAILEQSEAGTFWCQNAGGGSDDCVRGAPCGTE